MAPPVQAPPVYAPSPYAPFYAPPPGYVPPLAPRPSHVEMRSRKGLMIAGLSVFGGVYLWNAFIGYVAGEGRLAVPVAGPLLLIKDNDHDRSANAFLVFDALAQSAGVIMFIAGAASKHPVTVYDTPKAEVAIVPTATLGGAGLSAVGTF